jgi:amino acid adenylation domain-containing protein
MTSSSKAKPLPLSHGQQALWLIHQIAPKSAAYNVAFVVRVRSAVDVNALRNAFQFLTDRHAALRAVFSVQNQEPAQFVQERCTAFFEQVDVSAADEIELKRQVIGVQQRPFDLHRGPLTRMHLLTRSATDHVLIIVTHHIVLDGHSLGLLLDDFLAAYEAERNGSTAPVKAPIARQYTDYVAWEREMVAGPEGTRQREFWHRELAGELPLLNLPVDRPRWASQIGKGETYAFVLGADVFPGMQRLAQRERRTLFTVLLSAFCVLLGRYTGQEDIIVGTPTANRREEEFHNVVGYFASIVALRTDLSGNPSVRGLLTRVQKIVLRALENESYPFGLLVQELKPERDPHRTPIFEVMFNLRRPESFGILSSFWKRDPDGILRAKISGLALESYIIPQQEGRFDITLDLFESDDRVEGYLAYNDDLFNESTIVRLVDSYRLLLKAMAAEPELAIHELPVLPGAMKKQVLVDWNSTADKYPDAPLHELIAARAAAKPGAVAAVFQGEMLTYAELDRKANQLAHHLRELGVGPEVIVGLCVERSLDMLVGLLGILKAGGAYVPLDPTYPVDRIAFVLTDSKAAVLVSQDGLLAGLPKGATRTVYLDADWPAIECQPTTAPASAGGAQSLAYVIYTSGSTGQPKGVQITHRSLVNFLTSMQRKPGFSERDILLAVTTFSFDIAGLEFWLPLLAGGRVVVASLEVASDGAAMRRALIEHGVTVMQATPVTWRLLLEAGGPPPGQLKVLCGGEPLPPDLATALLSHGVELWNMYGPTETAIWSTLDRVTSSESITVGRPIANTEVFILDAYGKPAPVGVVGEIFIGGDGVARGYLDRPELTAERFVRNPFRDTAARLYRTGDLARYRADGRIEILGRADNQVKLRGYRIELGEIEAVVAQQTSVRDVAVIAREDVAGDKRLVGYVTAAGGGVPTAADLRTAVRQWLPDYMVPSAFVLLDSMPRTPNGKINRKALPAPDIDQARVVGAAYVPPETELQRTIAQVWSSVLRLEQVGLHDNFFDLGGHSFLLLKVHQQLSALLEKPISVADLFRFPNVHSLARHLSEQAEMADRPSAPRPLVQQRASDTNRSLSREIAIIGLAGRFPGARNVQEFWRNVCEGRESVSFFSPEELQSAGISPIVLADPNYVPAKGVIDDVELFDAQFFGINPPEAEVMDPQHRIFLECAWEALEDANCDPLTYEGAIGVFAGASMNTYFLTNVVENPTGVYSLGAYQAMIGNDKDFLATRASYKLNLRGPSMTVQTACSTSLVAVHQACQSLISSDSDIALAGAVSVSVPHRAGYFYQEGMILSPDGHCRPFDAAAAGTVAGEGCGIVVLKRLTNALADGDHIHAVLKGISVNNDGSRKLGYTAPSVDGQSGVIATAQALAGVSPETIGYVEAHGSGTPLGDPVEIAALTHAFQKGTDQLGYCAVGSVKANIGHLDVAAGMAGLIKAALAVKHGLIPPSVNFAHPNPEIDFAASPFYIPPQLVKWPDGGVPRRAGVSSFGIGGTNAHAVIEQAPQMHHDSLDRGWQVMPLSARTPRALDVATARLADYLEQNPELESPDVAFTLQTGRRSFSQRRVIIYAKDEVPSQLLRSGAARRVVTGSAKGEPGVVFMFSGQGAQYVNMARGLYEAEAGFRSVVDSCATSLVPHLGLDLRTLIFPDEEATEEANSRLQQTALAQPALFVVEYALSRLYMSWGVRPRAMIGHSIGEYVAACLAGVLSEGDALAIVAARGKLMQELPGGAMLSVPLPEADVAPLLGPELSLAVINAPGLCVIAGPFDAIDRLQRALTDRQIETRRLFTSHAFHSAMMEPAMAPFTERVRGIALQPPSIPFISNVTGDWITPTQATDPAYWSLHMRRTVRFGDGIARLLDAEQTVFLEIGPGQTLATFVRQHPAKDSARAILNTVRHPNQTSPDMLVSLTALAQLWLAGVPIDWKALHGERRPRRISLPSYPFERQRYWLDARATPAAGHVPSNVSSASQGPPTAVQYSVPVWQQQPLASTTVGARLGAESWLVFLDAEGLGERVARQLRAAGKHVVEVLPGAAFGRLDVDRYTVAMTRRADYVVLLDDLRSKAQIPHGVLHCWSVTANDHAPALESLAGHEERGFHSLLALVQAADGRLTAQPLKVVVVSNDMQDVTGDEPICAAKALLLGVTKVVPLEFPSVTCQSIDVRLPPPGSSAEEQLARQIAEEALSGEVGGLIAYRGRHRWTQILTPVDLGEPIGERLVRAGGTYLITGGLGAIGLVLADYLARQAPVNLVLVGRSPLPAPTDWDKWLEEHDGTHPTSERIRAVRALEKRGAQVLVAAADVSRLDEMVAVLKQIRDRFGAVHGVIHSAGVGDYDMLVRREPEQVARILAPKVRGTLVLDHLLTSDPMDFFASCSSIAALMPAAGQIDYCGANAFLDAFAHAAATRSGCRYLAINWDNWREVGMAVRTIVRPALKAGRDEDVQSGLSSSEGQAAFNALLHSGLTQALVARKVTADLVERPSTASSSDRAVSPSETTVGGRSRRERSELGSSYAPPRTETERRIVEIWQELLGIEPVGINDDFFELGGHSLLATQLISKVSKTLGVGVSLRALFDTGTIADFATQLDIARPSLLAEAEGDRLVGAVEPVRFLEGPGGHVSLEGERLGLNAPKEMLTEELEGLVAGRRREVIELLKDGGPSTPFIAATIPRVPRDRPIHASPGQAGLWFLDQVTPGDTSYVIIHAIRERSPLNLGAQEGALNAMLARHEALRTTFQEIDGELYQVIAPELTLSIPVQDLRQFSREEREAEASRLTADEARRPFDLARGPLLRYRILQLADDEWQSMLAVHHIVFDGWSLALFNREMAALAAAFAAGQSSPLADLPIQYADYAAWQREQLTGALLQCQLKYWRQQLAGPVPVLQLPCARPRLAARTSQGSVEYHVLSSERVQSVEELGRRNRATPFIIYLTAFGALLHRYSLQDDVLIGAPVAGRNRLETEGLLGLFVNTLVLRADASGNPTFTKLLSRIRNTTLDAFSNQDVPFEELVRALHPERSSSHTPLFQVMFNYINLESEAEPWVLGNGTSKYDLSVTLIPIGSGMQCVWEYSTDLFEAATIRGMAERFETLLGCIVLNPAGRILELPLTTEAERQQLLNYAKGQPTPYAEGATIPSLFQAQVARTPDDAALLSDGAKMSYRELNARANRLARRLWAAGVSQGVRVGVFLERSLEVWVSLLAVLKAGGTYVPLDPKYPHERLSFMLTDAKASVLITQQRLVPGLPAQPRALSLIDIEAGGLELESDEDLDVCPRPDDVAYVIYTSGSTGWPKGVEGTHQGAVNRFAWMWRAYPFAPGEIACQRTSLSFVDSIWELFGPLLQGVPTLLLPDQVVTDPLRLVELLAKQRVSRIVLVPALLRTLLDTAQDLSTRLPALRLWVTSGEAISVELAQRFRAAMPHATLLNLYGSSEVSADVTYYEVMGDEVSRIPIGRPIANTQVYVLDPARQPVPFDVPSEVYVGGFGLARGYLNAPDLTATRFVPDPFSPGLLFRTGDLGLYRADGNLDLLGRVDQEVKIRGIRIELGEIEAILREQPDVTEAVVAIRTGGEGEARLIAYLVSDGKAPMPDKLRAALRRRLPDYMIPSMFVHLPSLPLTRSGKVDRLALPEATGQVLGKASREAPRTDTEARLAALWQTLFDLESVGVRDGFFDLGGYSLLAVRMFAAIEKTFGKRLPMTTILEGDTIEHLAQAIDRDVAPSKWSSLVPLQSGGSCPPFFCVHPIDGDVFMYLALASRLGPDQPCYGLRARGLDGLSEPHPSLGAAASDYVREIKQVQPHGPYYLGGYSLGATIALEMAQQLRAGGDEVGLLASFDSAPTKTDYYKVRWGFSFGVRWVCAFPYRVARFLLKPGEDKVVVLRRKWHGLSRTSRGATTSLHDHALGFARSLAEDLFGGPKLVPAHHERVIAALYRCSADYMPREYSGRVTLFRAAHQPLTCSHDPLMDWARLARGGVDAQTVPGNHESILLEPNVRELARALTVALADSRASRPEPAGVDAPQRYERV